MNDNHEEMTRVEDTLRWTYASGSAMRTLAQTRWWRFRRAGGLLPRADGDAARVLRRGGQGRRLLRERDWTFHQPDRPARTWVATSGDRSSFAPEILLRGTSPSGAKRYGKAPPPAVLIAFVCTSRTIKRSRRAVRTCRGDSATTSPVRRPRSCPSSPQVVRRPSPQNVSGGYARAVAGRRPQPLTRTSAPIRGAWSSLYGTSRRSNDRGDQLEHATETRQRLRLSVGHGVVLHHRRW